MTTTPPTPRRLARPRWLDIRVLAGVVLVVVSVAVGAKVIGSASRTSPVWAAAVDLEAGTVLKTEDLVVADVNLGGQGSAYIDVSSQLVGVVINRAIRQGELMPASVLGEIGDSRVVSVVVSPERLAPGIRHGSTVDLYLIIGRAAVLGEEVSTELVQAGVTVQDVVAPASGGLSGAVSSRYQVALLLSPADADALVHRLPQGEPLMVLHVSGAGRAQAAAGGN